MAQEIRERYLRSAERLDELWEKYRGEGVRILEEWERDKIGLVESISKIMGRLHGIEAKEKELRVKIEIGVLREEDVGDRLGELRKMREELSGELELLQGVLKEIESALGPHRKRILPTLGYSAREEVRRRLEELEEMKARGEVDESVYNRIREELELMERLLS